MLALTAQPEPGDLQMVEVPALGKQVLDNYSRDMRSSFFSNWSSSSSRKLIVVENPESRVRATCRDAAGRRAPRHLASPLRPEGGPGHPGPSVAADATVGCWRRLPCARLSRSSALSDWSAW